MDTERIAIGCGAECRYQPACWVRSAEEPQPGIAFTPPEPALFRGRVVCEYPVYLNQAAAPLLTFGIGLVYARYEEEGAVFRIVAEGEVLFEKFIDVSDWFDQRVDLKAFAGKATVLEFSLESTAQVTGLWRQPQISDGGRVLYDMDGMTEEAEKYLAPASRDNVGQIEKNRRLRAAVRPSARQLAWQKREYCGFCVFGMGAYNDREWSDGTDSPDIFIPEHFDAEQWVRTVRDAGMNMLLVQAKHHDGFCMWQTDLTDYSLKSSPWRGGKGDIVGDVAAACHRHGVKLGIYLSPWDRHCPLYGTEAYNDFFKGQLRELLTRYGEVVEVWFDGACGEGPDGRKQRYDWEGYYRVIRELQPEAVIAITGPDVRWIGNENGLGRPTEWCVQYRGGAFVWYPAECDVSIRPGWFYHASEDGKLKSVDQLMEIYFASVGCNSVLLLSTAPGPDGLVPPGDIRRLIEFREARDKLFARDLAREAAVCVDGPACAALTDGSFDTYWRMPAATGEFTLEWDAPQRIRVVKLQEYIADGQRVEHFEIACRCGGEWRRCAEETTIGWCRMLRFDGIEADALRVRICGALDNPEIMNIQVF